MGVEFGATVRGDGKLYVGMHVDLPDEGALLQASSVSSAGLPLPALVVPFDQHPSTHALVLAELNCTQTVRVVVVDGQGREVDSAEKVFHHTLSVFESKARNFVGAKKGVEGIRDVDELLDESTTNLEIGQITGLIWGVDVMRGKASMLFPEGADPYAQVELAVIDRNGTMVECDAPPFFVTDELRSVEGDESGEDGTLREIEYAFKIPSAADDFVAWLRVDDPKVPDAMISMNRFWARDIRLSSLMVENTGIGEGYHDWFLTHQRASEEELEQQRRARFDINPTFSFIVPLFKTPLDLFAEMADSVLRQTYPQLELVLVNASPEDEELASAVEKLAQADTRVRIVTLEENYGITENTNAGIRAATGDFLCFFDHDDVLEPNLLYEYVAGINEYPETDLLYCDEDKLEGDRFFAGNLKPDFDWDLICSCNFVTHLLTVRKSILDSFDELPTSEFDGSQDLNMTLRVAEKARNIYHARRILYHWRVNPGSAANDANAKTWAYDAGVRAIQASLDRRGIPATVSGRDGYPGFYSVEYELPQPHELVSVIIPGGDDLSALADCLGAVTETAEYGPLEVVVVVPDMGQARDGLPEEVLSDERVRLVEREGELSVVAMLNQGAREAQGKSLIFLSSHCLPLDKGWAAKMIGPLVRDEVACVGARQVYPGRINKSLGIVFPKSDPVDLGAFGLAERHMYMGFGDVPNNKSAVSFDCVAIRRDVFERSGGLDEEMAARYSGIAWCLERRDEDMLVVMNPDVHVLDRGCQKPVCGDGLLSEAGDIELLRSKWPELFSKGDPYYNKNFSKGSNAFLMELS